MELRLNKPVGVALTMPGALTFLRLILILGKRPRRRKTTGAARAAASESPAPAKD